MSKPIHGHWCGNKASPTYISWRSLKVRCMSDDPDKYPYYKGRGITYCERWESFENFLADMGERPEGKTLDRIDNEGNYEPSNCRWATGKEQRDNQGRYKLRDDNSSGYTGVSWFKPTKKWRAYINIRGKQIHLGYFDYPETAHYAYEIARENYIAENNLK